ncbi:MAG TPA: biotin synthase [Burkholderiaceae bacterium]|nr:biotin synthase [Burkholderiaceae bacterium]
MPSPDPHDARRLDAVAVAAALRRLARAPEPAWLHGEVARRMAERLEIVRLKPDLILDWGGELGASGPLLQRAYPKARRIVVEPDAHWAERSRAATKSGWWPARRWGATVEVMTQADELPASAQLIWSNMALHAVVDPPLVFERWQRLLRVGGFVMFSCLGPDTLRELRAIYERLGWPAPTPGFVDMHDLGDMMTQAGFADPVMDQETLTLRYASAQAALDELRTLGGNTAPDRMQGLRTPRWRRQLERELDALKGADGKLGLSFEVAYGHAFKAAPRLRVGEATTVSLEDMRAMVRSGRPTPGS